MTIESKGRKILVVLTNTSTLRKTTGRTEPMTGNPETRTGFDVKPVAYIWECLHKQRRMTVDFCTPEGGCAPMDPQSAELCHDDQIVQEFLKDRNVIDMFKDTTCITNIMPEEYCAVILPGSHGALCDFPKNTTLTNVLTCVYCNQNGMIATIGHGIAGLLSMCTRMDKTTTSCTRMETTTIGSGTPFLKGKKVTCFTNDEEKKIGYEKTVPFMLEDKLKELGAIVFNKGPFETNVCIDERLITAQNMKSTKEWLNMIVKEGNLNEI